ncbi:MAG: WhiB family transcriptional regulator [Actinomycetota bacterium]|nr:WhiB family transcriptional regulator [Actinomycetota bacterium]
MTYPVTRRERIIAHLAAHPGLTAGEVARALRLSGPLNSLLRDMEERGQVTASKIWWPQQGRQVNVWRVAAAGTAPLAVPRETIECRRELGRLSQARSRARARGLVIPPGGTVPDLRVPAGGFTLPAGAACRAADPEMFFPEPGQDDSEARAICAACPIRVGCYDLARATGQQFGVWGGTNFDVTAAVHREAKAS